jgi:hypothetical protein
MSGRAIGLGVTSFSGLRVAAQPTWIPPHKSNGVDINSRIIIPTYCNSHRGKDQKTGEKGRSDTFRLVVWGKLADTCARSLLPGNAIDVVCRPHSYLGKVYNKDGSVRVDMAGVPIEVTKVAFTVIDMIFAEETEKNIASSIQAGRRPMNWNVKGHPDWDMWVKILTEQHKEVWDGRSGVFGKARVIVPQGTSIVLDFTRSAAGAGAVGYAQPGQQTTLPQQVANAFGANTAKFDPYTGQPLVQAQAVAQFDPYTGQRIMQQPTPPPQQAQGGSGTLLY